MTRPRFAALALTLFLAACGSNSGQSHWYNPFSWFGGSKEVTSSMAVPAQETGDPRPLVDQVISMAVEQMPEGAIVRATGLPATQGYWAGALLQDEIKDGRMIFRFVLVPPESPAPVSTQRSREVTVAATVTTMELEGVREIVVQGGRNARSSRR